MEKLAQISPGVGKRPNHLVNSFLSGTCGSTHRKNASPELPSYQMCLDSPNSDGSSSGPPPKRLRLNDHSPVVQDCVYEELPKLKEWSQSPPTSRLPEPVVPDVDDFLTVLSEDGNSNKRAKNADCSRSKPEDYVPSKAVHKKARGSKNLRTSGVSMVEFLTRKEIKEHLSGLGKLSGQMTDVTQTVSENTCQLCGEEKRFFDPAPIYCSSCQKHIKKGAVYYGTPETITEKHLFCASCYGYSGGGTVKLQGISISKKDLERRRNDEGTGEPWVQCDICAAWQHQICSLFNAKKDVTGKANYICPLCSLKVIDDSEGATLSKESIFTAKDLPRTKLSDHIEHRLHERLKQEREERAKTMGKKFDEVPGAEDLVLRVVSSLPKRLKINKQLLDIFDGGNYPAEFPYNSKVIVLFQKIGGVDVLIFGMYVQEFSDCGGPNQRHVYISYLDSVKYFQPEIMTVAGESLRTFVYHEILIGYLEHCKARGFLSCYIWSCPPSKGDDYLFFCHPEFQKTPKILKLRKWYQSMFDKSAKENIVVSCTNLFDKYFTSGGGKFKISATRLPYFEGDYWPGSAVNLLNNIEQSHGEFEKTGESISKRALKAMGHKDLSDKGAKDILLMQKLGEMIRPMKEDFIVADLQSECTRCGEANESRGQFFCTICRNYQICERCRDMQQVIGETCKCEPVCKEKHLLSKGRGDCVPSRTKDEDITLDSALFENRQQFLEFCQDNNYQFDSLRRAKHSSMMILYHLSSHILKLMSDPSIANSPGVKDRELEPEALWTQDLLKLLVHASRCPTPKSHPGRNDRACSKLKALFHHARNCSIRASNGCRLCIIVWTGLRLHATSCKEASDCRVPWCSAIKEKSRANPARVIKGKRQASSARVINEKPRANSAAKYKSPRTLPVR